MTLSVSSGQPQGAVRTGPRGMRARAGRLCRLALSAVEVLIGLLIIGAVLLNVANIFGRYVIGQSIIGADEVLVYGMIAIIFLGVIVVTARDQHLRVNLLSDLAPGPVRRGLRRLEWLVLAGLVALMGWLGFVTAHNMYTFGQKSLSAGIPMDLPHGIVAASLGITALVALGRAIGPQETGTDAGSDEAASDGGVSGGEGAQ